MATESEVIFVEPTGDAWLELRGEVNYQIELAELLEGAKADASQAPLAILHPEPDNPHDPNAVLIRIEGRRVGYLSREEAVVFGPAIRAAASIEKRIACRAGFIQGTQRARDGTALIRVRLRIGTPLECLARITGEEVPQVTVRTDHPWPNFLIAITGDSAYSLRGLPLDRATIEMLARQAGLTVQERVTRQVQLLVDCDPRTVSGNERRAVQFGVPIVPEAEFWAALGVPVERR